MASEYGQNYRLFSIDRLMIAGGGLINRLCWIAFNDIIFNPEVILFLIANPAYLESDYHREKNNIDFELNTPLLSKESLEWLINAIESAYPKGNKRLEQIMDLQQIL